MIGRKRNLDIDSSSDESDTVKTSSANDKKKTKMESNIDKIFAAEKNLLNGKPFSAKYHKILKQRRGLPVYGFLDALNETLMNNQVVVLEQGQKLWHPSSRRSPMQEFEIEAR